MANETNILITKASGEIVPFASEKLFRSLAKAGATKAQAEEILVSVEPLQAAIAQTKHEAILQEAEELCKNISQVAQHETL